MLWGLRGWPGEVSATIAGASANTAWDCRALQRCIVRIKKNKKQKGGQLQQPSSRPALCFSWHTHVRVSKAAAWDASRKLPMRDATITPRPLLFNQGTCPVMAHPRLPVELSSCP